MKRLMVIAVLFVVAATVAFANGTSETGALGNGPEAQQGIQNARGGAGQGSALGAGRGVGPGDAAGAGQAAGRGNGRAGRIGGGGIAEREDIAVLIEGVPSQELSEAEIEGLVLMREEEKLARDVYAALYETWNLPVFQSISRSEAQHMEAVAALLDRYKIEDPVMTDEAGVFSDSTLQSLYDDLVDSGGESLAAALSVGATIEDLDISDLLELVEASDNDDVRIVYQNLLKGSRNHFRSFVAQLERLGESYEAQYMSQDYLEKILRISREVAPITDPDYAI